MAGGKKDGRSTDKEWLIEDFKRVPDPYVDLSHEEDLMNL